MKNIILNKVKELESDITMFDFDNTINLTIDDLEGFDEDWSEVERELENSNGVNEFLEFLANTCKSMEQDFYTTYNYDGFNVVVGYSSFDI